MRFVVLGRVLPIVTLIFVLIFSLPGISEAQRAYTNRARIIAIQAMDLGLDSEVTTSIDVTQDECDEDDTLEQFSDTILKIIVANDSYSTLQCNKISFSVPNATLTGKGFRSKKYSVVGLREVEGQNELGELYSLGFDSYEGAKFFPGSSTAIPQGLGFRNITVRLFCKLEGRRVTLKGRTALSFDNFDRCN